LNPGLGLAPARPIVLPQRNQLRIMMRIGLSDPGLWNTLDRRECSFMALRMVCPDADVRDGGSVVAGKFTSKQVSSLVRWRAIDDGCDRGCDVF
jgi:hypothetical protein